MNKNENDMLNLVNTALKPIRDNVKRLDGAQTDEKLRLDKHLDIYAKNGKELEAVKVNQAWLMRFFFLFMTPLIAGIVYIALNIK